MWVQRSAAGVPAHVVALRPPHLPSFGPSFDCAAALVTKCLECCAEDTKEGDRVVFTSATLEYCPVSLRHYVHVDSFLREHEKEPLPALKLRQRLGMPPRLVLKGSGQSTTVPIGQWKVEHIREYLAERVNPAGGDQAAEA